MVLELNARKDPSHFPENMLLTGELRRIATRLSIIAKLVWARETISSLILYMYSYILIPPKYLVG
jgi:hypothetical protein